jgi:hypothetical protein
MNRTDEEPEDWGVENDDDDEPTIPCPYCHEEMFEDSPRCPHCGRYISEEDAPPGRKPLWIILGVVLCLIVIAIWIVQFF